MTFVTIPNLRWQCPQGHFVADKNIHCQDAADPDAYYGVTTSCEYICTGCRSDDDPYMYFDLPRMVEVGRSAVEAVSE